MEYRMPSFFRDSSIFLENPGEYEDNEPPELNPSNEILDDYKILTRQKSKIRVNEPEIKKQPEKIPRNLPSLIKSKSAITWQVNKLLHEQEPIQHLGAVKVNEQIKPIKRKPLKIVHTEVTNQLFEQKIKQPKKDKPSKQIITIIKKVVEWRKLCYIEFEQKGNPKLTKEDAAKFLGMKKKSLDDYLMLIRLGLTLNYPFEENLSKKFGELRKWVKFHKKADHRWIKDKHGDIEELLIRLTRKS